MVKFSSKMDEATLEKLRSYSKSSGRNLSTVLTEAVNEYLERIGVRPTFREATDAVLSEHEELLRKLAQ